MRTKRWGEGTVVSVERGDVLGRRPPKYARDFQTWVIVELDEGKGRKLAAWPQDVKLTSEGTDDAKA